jgi:hypothetical protein
VRIPQLIEFGGKHRILGKVLLAINEHLGQQVCQGKFSAEYGRTVVVKREVEFR